MCRWFFLLDNNCNFIPILYIDIESIHLPPLGRMSTDATNNLAPNGLKKYIFIDTNATFCVGLNGKSVAFMFYKEDVVIQQYSKL